jgi:putative restriction endonuclease
VWHPAGTRPFFPVFVSGWDAGALKAQIIFGEGLRADAEPPRTDVERRYALRQVKQRLHQAQFRAAVLTAYDGRCALSRFPEARLLDAAHIMPDLHDHLGQPIVPNGLPLSKIHHAAFDAPLIGIDPDFRLHISERLLAQDDGPMLESLKALDGRLMHLPKRAQDYPDRERLAQRFALFRSAA